MDVFFVTGYLSHVFKIKPNTLYYIQRQIDQLIEETRAERNELQQSVEERCVRQEQKKESAATKIQATFRRFR